jgi:cobalt/nickel transport protein
MNKKKMIIGLIVLTLLTPIGIYLPTWFKGEDAWGEWSLDTLKEKLGFAPEGMKKDAELWKAPLPDYSIGEGNGSAAKQSASYILSGIVGVGIISLISFVLYKMIKKE